MDVEYKLSAKRVELNVLEAERDTEELWEYDEYQRLQQQIAALEKQVTDEDGTSEGTHTEAFVFEAETQG